MLLSLRALILGFFVIWLVPIGAFIRPGKEGEMCDGRRAVCLCVRMAAQQKSGMFGKVALKGGSVPKEEGSAPSFLDRMHSPATQRPARWTVHGFAATDVLYSFRYVRSIEHVPLI